MAAALLTALLGSLSSCESGSQPQGGGDDRFHVRSERIGYLGAGYKPRSLVVSRDHEHLAWIDERKKGCRVVVDRKEGPLFAQCADPRFSPDATTLLYWAAAEITDPPTVRLVANGKPSEIVLADNGPTRFSRTGGAWAAVAPARIESPSPEATAEEKRSPETPPQDAAATAESPPHRVIAFDARGSLGEHADATPPALSPDGAHVAYIAADEEGRQNLIVDGQVKRTFAPPDVKYLPSIKQTKPGPNLEPETTVQYLADGTLVGVALDRDGWTVFHGDDVWATYPVVRGPPNAGVQILSPDMVTSRALLAGSLVFAEAAPTACWWERREGDADAWLVVCNGKPVDQEVCEAYSVDVPISVSSDGRTAAYACRQTPPSAAPENVPRNLWVVLQGKKVGPYRFVWGIELSADGSHHAYAASDELGESWFYMVDGKRYDGPWEQAFPPKLSPDGTSVVWAASQEEDGPRVDLVFDGTTVARAEIVMAPPVFHGNREVQWAVKRGRSVRRVIVTAPERRSPDPGAPLGGQERHAADQARRDEAASASRPAAE
jgi:hypothetical protein